MVQGVLLYIVVASIATLVVWKGSDVLEGSSEQLAAYYELPGIVQGAIIAAVGSSFPELSSTVLSTLLHGQFDLGVAAITGSAIFNILVIPGVSALAGSGNLKSSRDLVYKEAQFYMVSVAVLLLTFSFAVIYYPVPGKQLIGTLSRPLAIIPILLYILYLFIQYQDTVEFDAPEVTDINLLKQWGLLLLSLAIIAVGVEGLVWSAIGLGELFNTPSVLWGLTVIAAGTSLPDAFISVKAAKKGNADTSVANVLGSNVFDLLVAVPIGVLIAGSTAVNYGRVAPMFGILTLATVMLFAMMRTDLEIERWEAYSMLGMYGMFLMFIVSETVGFTSLIF